LRSACARTARDLPARLRSRVTLKRDGRRWCQAASIRSRRAWLLPVLVIAPWRRRSPLEFSLGVRPRNGPSDSGRNLFQSPSSTVNANAVSVETPRRQTSRSTTSRYGDVAASSAIASSRASRLGLRVEHAAVTLVEHDRERPALEPLPAKPCVVCPRPGGRVVHPP